MEAAAVAAMTCQMRYPAENCRASGYSRCRHQDRCVIIKRDGVNMPGAEAEAKAAAMLTALGLTWETGKPVGAWSGGMKRRLALARALLAPSEAIALDEPFTGLDDENRQRAIRAIRRVAETKPVLLVTHDRTELNLLRANIVNL